MRCSVPVLRKQFSPKEGQNDRASDIKRSTRDHSKTTVCRQAPQLPVVEAHAFGALTCKGRCYRTTHCRIVDIIAKSLPTGPCTAAACQSSKSPQAKTSEQTPVRLDICRVRLVLWLVSMMLLYSLARQACQARRHRGGTAPPS